MLEIGVHDDDGPAPRRVEPGGDGDLLAEIARKGQRGKARVGGVKLAQGLQSLVARAVVDQDDLEGKAKARQNGREPRRQRPQIARLVEHRHDDGKLWSGSGWNWS